MQKIYNKTIDNELKPKEEETEKLLSGYKRLKIPLLSEAGRSAWSKRFPLKRIKELRKRVGEKKFQAQMQLQPVNLTDPFFNINDFKTYDICFSKTEQNFRSVYKINNEKVVQASSYWDPSSGGRKRDGSVLVIAFKDNKDRIYIEEIIYLNSIIKRGEEGITKQIEEVLSILKKYDIGIIHIETNGIGKFIPELINKEIRRLRLKIEVSEIYNHNSKSIRIMEGIEPLVSAEIISFNKTIFSKANQFINEIKNWRTNIDGKDDGLDAVSGITLNRFKNIIPSPSIMKFY